MTGADLVTHLELRLEDENNLAFTDATIIKALNLSQLKLINLVHRNFLEPFEVKKSGAVPSSGSYTLDSANLGSGNFPILDKRILDVYDGKNYRWCIQVESEDRKSLKDVDWDNTDNYLPETYFYVYADTLYLLPSNVDTIDIYYLKQPSDIANDSTGLGWSEQLKEPLLDFAEAELWRMDGNESRMSTAYSAGANYLSALNATITKTVQPSSVRDVMTQNWRLGGV